MEKTKTWQLRLSNSTNDYQQSQQQMQTIEEIKEYLANLYTQNDWPWLVGFSGGKDSTMVASLVFQTAKMCQHIKKPIFVFATNTLVEIPAIVESIETTLSQMKSFAHANNLNIQVATLKPQLNQSFWVNIIGRGYPAPNYKFRWCTQRLKINPANKFILEQLGTHQNAILHLGARRSESQTRAKTMSLRKTINGLSRHPNLQNVLICNPIEFLTTEEVWAYLLNRPNPWGGNNRELYRLYAKTGGGECPVQIDSATPSCGNSRFGCWTCTVVYRDKASEGLLEHGDTRMQELIQFRKMLLHYRDWRNGKRTTKMRGGKPVPSALTLEARKELLSKLLDIQSRIGLQLISQEEIDIIHEMHAALQQNNEELWNHS